MRRIDRQVVKKVFQKPSINDDKYSRGVLGVFAGSKKYPGAAVLTTKSASRTGVGMIRFLVNNKKVCYLVLEKSPEVVIQSGQVQGLLIGSGISSGGGNFLSRLKIKKLINQKVPTVLDAGAINFVKHMQSPCLITPHYKELQALFSANNENVDLTQIRKDPIKWAKKASQDFSTTVLLKGNTTIITDGKKVLELASSTTYLATAGSGDVLAGILGALVATNYVRIKNNQISMLEIAHAGFIIQQEVAEITSANGPMGASQMIENIAPVIRKDISTKLI